MKKTCQVAGHSGRPLSLLCTNTKCTNSRILCFQCLTTNHKDCLDHTLEISHISQPNFLQNSNWIKDPNVKLVIQALEDHKLSGAKDEVFGIFSGLLDQEFEKLGQHLLQKLQETKEKMLKNFKESPTTLDNKLKDFTKQLKSLYDLDSLFNIVDSWQGNKKNLNVVSQNLDDFFKKVSFQTQQEGELRKLAKDLSFSLKNFVQVDQVVFEDFKASIPFEIFDTYPSKKTLSQPNSEQWCWDISRKSKTINLKESNMRATKETGANGEYAAVIGNVKMVDGCHSWKIEVATYNSNRSWICFGVIEERFCGDMENLPYEQSIGFSTYRQPYQMNVIGALTEYDNKVFLCKLDLESGVFTISHNDNVICKSKNNLVNRVFLPFVCMSTRANTVKMTIA